jgi:hypothetical protein
MGADVSLKEQQQRAEDKVLRQREQDYAYAQAKWKAVLRAQGFQVIDEPGGFMAFKPESFPGIGKMA